MDDSFLTDLRQSPSPEFAERLGARLRAQPPPPSKPHRPWLTSRLVVPALSAAVVALLFTFPAVRASAQAFLNLFRVVNFVAVPVDRGRVDLLRGENLDLPSLIGEQVTVLADPGPAVTVTSIEAAGATAGMKVQVPSVVPSQTSMIGVKVSGERALRVTLSTERLQQVLETLDIRDIEIPADMNGRSATIRVPPVVEMAYERGSDPKAGSFRRAELFQVQSPIVDMPPGLNLATFGEIGLRILGVDAGESRRLAQQIDWHSTLLVPIPPNVSAFHQVQVRGGHGLALETSRRPNTPTVRMIIWSNGGRVFALQGTFELGDLLEMANSVR